MLAAVVAQAPAPPARAQEAAVPMGEELFRRGKQEMAAGEIPKACASFQESQRMSPASGTLLNLAVCHEKLGLVASAWAEYNQVPSLALRDGRPDRESFAREHASLLESKLPHLTVVVLPRADVPGLAVKLDGEDLGRAAWGTAAPIDPGHHVLEAAAPGRNGWSVDVDISPAPEKRQVLVPPLSTAPPAPVAAPAASARAAEPRPDDSGAAQRRVGLLVGGAGVAALGVGIVFGAMAIAKNHEASQICGETSTCPLGSAGPDDSRTALRYATVSTIMVPVGVIGIGAGLYLLLSARGAPRAAPALQVGPLVGRGGGGISLEGGW